MIESRRLPSPKVGNCLRAALVASVSLLALPARADVIVNDNSGAGTSGFFTQSEAAVLAFGSTILVGFNDSGSFPAANNQFTGYARSTDGGLTFTDMGTLPTSVAGDAGNPHLARNTATGAVYLTTLPFQGNAGVQLFRSIDGGITFTAPINATPGAAAADFHSLAVDNFAGPGNGTVYIAVRDFGAPNGIYLYKSTDGGLTFGPGVLLVSGASGANGPTVVVQPDHSVSVAWYQSGSIEIRRSTDGGATFGPATTMATLAPAGTNGNLGLTGIRQGTAVAAPFRSNEFPQIVVDPATGTLYAVFNAPGAGSDKADIFLVQSTDGGATWSAPIRINGDLTTNDQWQPTIAITPDGQNLGIFWYDRRADPNNNLIEYYGRICAITGSTLTCGSEIQVSDVAFLPEFGRDSIVNPIYMGDYDVAAADDNFFYVAWGDNLQALAGGSGRMDPNVFFDRVAISRLVAVPEPSSLALIAAGLLAIGLRRRRVAG